MHRTIVVALALAGVVAVAGPHAQRAGGQPAAAGTVLVFDTVKGTIEVELYDKDAPKSIEHILTLVRRGFYRGQRFHWVQPAVIQIGDPNSRNMAQQNIWGEGGSGTRIGVAEIGKRPFEKGSVGVAYRAGQTQTDADSQMFICRVANPGFNGKYTMIGHVIKGMDVVEKIEFADVLKMLYVKGETPK